MGYSQALEQQVAVLGHVRDLRRTDGSGWGDSEEEMERMLAYADTYYWARPICTLMQHASVELPPTWRWTPEMLPTREGFIWFEQPIGWKGLTEANVSPTVLSAVAWSSGVIQETGEHVLNVCGFTAGSRHPMPLMLVQMTKGQSIQDRIEDPSLMKLEGQYLATGGCMLLTLAACLTFLQQRILIAPKHRADRPARRRLERQGYQSEPLIRVVELRRRQTRSEHSNEHEAVEWSCQWIVSGHWRNQWYPSLNDYQPRWIMPYVKGPEDAPLKPPRAKVFAVVR